MPVAGKSGRINTRKIAVSRRDKAAEPAPAIDHPAEANLAEEIPAEHYQSHAKKVVSGNFANILDRMAKKSVEGSLSHTKYLFEIGGVKEDIERLGQEAEPSLADLLHEEIQKQRAAEEARRRDAEERAGFDARVDPNEDSGADCGAKQQ